MALGRVMNGDFKPKIFHLDQGCRITKNAFGGAKGRRDRDRLDPFGLVVELRGPHTHLMQALRGPGSKSIAP